MDLSKTPLIQIWLGTSYFIEEWRKDEGIEVPLDLDLWVCQRDGFSFVEGFFIA